MKIDFTNCIVIIFVLASCCYAGSLEPAASPAPTMKTLDEVEPRIPIPGSDTATGPFIISQSGSYYLEGNRLCNANGIQVEADNVKIDLMGYSLIGTDSGTYYGIYMNERTNVEIRNGTIRDFYGGIYENSYGNSHRIINVNVMSNLNKGIFLYSSGNVIKDCVVSDNGNSSVSNAYAVYANESSTVTGNIVYNNGTSATCSYFYGIWAGTGCALTNNTVHDNANSATSNYAFALYSSTGCTVSGNTVYKNGTDATVIYLGGIYTGDGNTVMGNTSRNNGDASDCDYVYGIRCGSGCTINSNTSSNNGVSADCDTVYGISAGSGSSVIGNTARSNGLLAGGMVYGINLAGNHLVDQNSAYGNNGTNMDTALASCTYGVNYAP